MTQAPETFYGPFVRLLICLAGLSFLSGCGPGSGLGLDENGNPIGGDSGGGDGGAGGASGNPNATLSWLQDNVFGSTCIQCHTGAAAPLGVDWSSESESCANVGQTSGEIPTLMVIKSGDPAESYLIWKVAGTGPNGEAIVGARMPLLNPPLTAEAIQNMQDWIADGTLGCQTQQSTGFVNFGATKFDLPADGNPPGDSAYPVGTWTSVWHESLQLCATCHSINPTSPACLNELRCPPAGVVLSIDNYFGVVDGDIVAPFDPGASRLWRRVIETDPVRRMPYGLAPLSQEQQDILFNWIVDGAPIQATPGESR